ALFADLRYGARRLAATRSFTAITVLTLAIGIGGTTAIFSVVHPIVFGSLPYPQADRVGAVLEQYANGSRTDGTFAMYREFADRAIVGREIRLDDNLYTVIGVMPRGFENVTAPSAALWTTLQYDQSLPPNGREWGHHLKTTARLRPGIGASAATREIQALGRAL